VRTENCPDHSEREGQHGKSKPVRRRTANQKHPQAETDDPEGESQRKVEGDGDKGLNVGVTAVNPSSSTQSVFRRIDKRHRSNPRLVCLSVLSLDLAP
jgi:hypothetical protein